MLFLKRVLKNLLITTFYKLKNLDERTIQVIVEKPVISMLELVSPKCMWPGVKDTFCTHVKMLVLELKGLEYVAILV